MSALVVSWPCIMELTRITSARAVTACRLCASRETCKQDEPTMINDSSLGIGTPCPQIVGKMERQCDDVQEPRALV